MASTAQQHDGSTEADPDAIAAAARRAEGVIRLSGGVGGEVATYLPGRQVSGVRVRSDEVQVHIVAVYGVPVRQTAEGVRRAVLPLAAGLPVNVSVDDVALPGEQDQDAPADGSRSR